jgi:hypothetical protein
MLVLQVSTDVQQMDQTLTPVIGKANMTELLGWGVYGTNSQSTVGGQTRSALRQDAAVGGSSGGSTVGVIAGFCIASLGTDSLNSLVSFINPIPCLSLDWSCFCSWAIHNQVQQKDHLNGRQSGHMVGMSHGMFS